MRTVYQTTRPCFYDTIAICRGKLLQEQTQHNAAHGGLESSHDTTATGFHDTQVISLQKQLKALH